MTDSKPFLPRYAMPALAGSVLLLSAMVAAFIYHLHPMPPRTITMVTGPEGSAYSEFGKRYRDILAQSGITLQLLPTAGDLENVRQLRDSQAGVSIGFVDNGFTNESESPELVSLGTLGFQPLWVFLRSDQAQSGLKDIPGKRISIGPEGSGTRALALQLLELNGIDITKFQSFPFSPQEAADQLEKNQIDMAVFLTSWDSPVVKRLIAADHIALANFPRADAYVALYPFLNKLILPTGVGNLAKNKPPQDVSVLATKVNLVVRKELHPSIAYLLLNAAERIHSAPGLFQKAGQFPAAEAIDLPLSTQARSYYKSGPPFLQKYLPYWLAVMAQQAIVILIPVLGLAYPIGRGLAMGYAAWMRFRILRLYNRLRRLEIDMENLGAGRSKTDLMKELDDLEQSASHARVAAPYSPMQYTLIHHIALVREKISRPGT